MGACDRTCCVGCFGLTAIVGTGIGFILGPIELGGAYSRAEQLEQAKGINTLCCTNMTGQPTDACQALFPSAIKLNEAFMDFLCQRAKDSIDDLPERIVSRLTWGGIAGGITALSILGCVAYVTYKACQKRREYTIL